jgi:hypothetical protein
MTVLQVIEGARALLARPSSKEIAMDIGKDLAAYIEGQYPETVKAASSTFLLSVRNCTYNKIMAALKETDPARIRERLKENARHRRSIRKMRKLGDEAGIARMFGDKAAGKEILREVIAEYNKSGREWEWIDG